MFRLLFKYAFILPLKITKPTYVGFVVKVIYILIIVFFLLLLMKVALHYIE
jgi:hypothetical protein